MIKDIWKQPAKGFTEATIGRTEEQIVQKEVEISFKKWHKVRDICAAFVGTSRRAGIY